MSLSPGSPASRAAAAIDDVPPTRLYRTLRWVVVVGVAALTTYVWVRAAAGGGLRDYLAAGLYSLLVSGVYLLGFLRCFPEAIGGRLPATSAEGARRWKDFAHVSFWIALATAIGAVGLVVEADEEHWMTSGSLAILTVGLLATQLELVKRATLGAGIQTAATGPNRPWRSAARWIAARWSPRISLSSASLLILSSVFLVTSVDSCGSTHYRGHQVLSREANWIIANKTDSTWHSVIHEIDRAAYALALATALGSLVLTFTVLRRRGPSSRVLAWGRGVTAGMALWVVCTPLRFFVTHWTGFVILAVLWLAPPLLWARYGRSENPAAKARWFRWRALFIVLCMPVVAFVDYYTLLFTLDSPALGYLCFFLGTQWLWWGYVTLTEQPRAPVVRAGLQPGTPL